MSAIQISRRSFAGMFFGFLGEIDFAIAVHCSSEKTASGSGSRAQACLLTRCVTLIVGSPPLPASIGIHWRLGHLTARPAPRTLICYFLQFGLLACGRLRR